MSEKSMLQGLHNSARMFFGGARFGSKLEAMEVFHQVLLQYRDGPKVAIPDVLLQEENGIQYLKIRPSNFTIAKLVLGHMENFKKLNNPSLAACPQIPKLNDMVKDAIRAAVKKEMTKDIEDLDKDELFEEPADASEDSITGKQMRSLLQKAPAIVKIKIGDADIPCLVPKSWKSTDIMVQLQADILQAVFDFIMEDIHNVFSQNKRAYKKSGLFSSASKRTKGDGHGNPEGADETGTD